MSLKAKKDLGYLNLVVLRDSPLKKKSRVWQLYSLFGGLYLPSMIGGGPVTNIFQIHFSA